MTPLVQQGKHITRIQVDCVTGCSEKCIKFTKIQEMDRAKYYGKSFLEYSFYIEYLIKNDRCIDCMKGLLQRAKESGCYIFYKKNYERTDELWKVKN